MRKRFNSEEKSIIEWCISDLHFNTVHWKDASNWTKLARLVDGEILTDEFRSQYVEAVNITSTATCEYGRKIRIYASGIKRA